MPATLPRRVLIGLPALLPPAAMAAAPGLHVVMPFAAGSPPHRATAAMMDALAQETGRPLRLEERPSTRGTAEAALAVARAEADGSVLLATTQSHLTNDLVLPGLPFHPLHDFTPVALLAEAPVVVMATGAPGGAQTLGELIARMRRQPDALRFASPGPGTTPHIVAQVLLDAAGVTALHLPFANMPRAMEALAAGQIDVLLDAASTAVRFGDGRTLRPLAVLAPQRLPALPEVPTVAEASPPGILMPEWAVSFLLLAPAGTPAATAARLNAAVERMLAGTALRNSLLALGLQPRGGHAPALLQEVLAADRARLLPLVKRALGQA